MDSLGRPTSEVRGLVWGVFWAVWWVKNRRECMLFSSSLLRHMLGCDEHDSLMFGDIPGARQLTSPAPLVNDLETPQNSSWPSRTVSTNLTSIPAAANASAPSDFPVDRLTQVSSTQSSSNKTSIFLTLLNSRETHLVTLSIVPPSDRHRRWRMTSSGKDSGWREMRRRSRLSATPSVALISNRSRGEPRLRTRPTTSDCSSSCSRRRNFRRGARSSNTGILFFKAR